MIKQNVQYIRSVITGCIGGFTGALMVGGIHAASNLYGNSSWLGALMTANGILRYLLDMAVAFVTAFLLSWILYRREEKGRDGLQKDMEAGGAQTIEAIPNKKRERLTEKIWFMKREEKEESEEGVIYSPLQGQVILMEEVPDDTFAAKVLGDGMAVIPSEGVVYAPFDGKVEKLYDEKHAISISSMDGIELLIHVGIATEELAGKFFDTLVSTGDQIQRGERLLEFDIAGMKEAGYSTVTPVIVTNSDDYDAIYLEGNGMIDDQDILMKIASH